MDKGFVVCVLLGIGFVLFLTKSERYLRTMLSSHSKVRLANHYHDYNITSIHFLNIWAFKGK